MLGSALFLAPMIGGSQLDLTSVSPKTNESAYLAPTYVPRKDCCGDSFFNLTGDSLDLVVAEVLSDHEVNLLKQSLIGKGYSPNFDESYGVTCNMGCEVGVVLTFDGPKTKAGIIYLSVDADKRAVAIISTEIGGIPIYVYEIDDEGNLVDYGDMECDGYRSYQNFICAGESSCNGVIFHQGDWCDGTKSCIGHEDTHWHDLTWCGHYSLCKYMRVEYSDPPCGVTWDKCWMSCWDMIWSMRAPGCWPGGGYLSRECYYHITGCNC